MPGDRALVANDRPETGIDGRCSGPRIVWRTVPCTPDAAPGLRALGANTQSPHALQIHADAQTHARRAGLGMLGRACRAVPHAPVCLMLPGGRGGDVGTRGVRHCTDRQWVPGNAWPEQTMQTTPDRLALQALLVVIRAPGPGVCAEPVSLHLSSLLLSFSNHPHPHIPCTMSIKEDGFKVSCLLDLL